MLTAIALAAALQGAPAAVPAQAAPDPKAAFFAAAREGRADIVLALLDAGAPLNARDERGYTALTLAAYNGKTDLVRTLIKRGADACAGDARGNTALMGAAFKGDDAVARLLLDETACPVDQANAQGQTALMLASLFGRETQVRLLLAKGASPTRPDATGQTARTLAAAQGAAVIQGLLGSD